MQGTFSRSLAHSPSGHPVYTLQYDARYNVKLVVYTLHSSLAVVHRPQYKHFFSHSLFKLDYILTGKQERRNVTENHISGFT